MPVAFEGSFERSVTIPPNRKFLRIGRFFLACCQTTITHVYDKQHSPSVGMYVSDNTSEMTVNTVFTFDSVKIDLAMGNIEMLIFHDAVAEHGCQWGQKKTRLWPGARQASEDAQAVSHALSLAI